MDGLLGFFEQQFKKGEPYREAVRGLLRGDTSGFDKLNAPTVANPQEAVDIATGFAGTIKPVSKTAFETAQEVAQLNASLPVSQGGLGLPANNTAMDRAKAMGFDTDVYRGENLQTNPININDYILYASNNPTVANTYAGANKGAVLPLKTKSSELANIDYKGMDWDSAPYPAIIKNQGKSYTVPKGRNSLITDEIGKFSKNLGQKGLEFENINDIGLVREGVNLDKLNDIQNFASPVSSYAIFDPSIIRSRFAAFDPFRRNEADILAGVAAAPVGLLAVDKEKKKKKNK